MHVPRLRSPHAVRGSLSQTVTLQHDYLIETIGERPRGRKPGHAGADHNGLLADQIWRHRAYPLPALRAIDCIAALDRLWPIFFVFGAGERRSSDLWFVVYLRQWCLTHQRSVKRFTQ